MLSQSEVYEIFAKHVPDHVDVLMVPVDDYIGRALEHSFIQRQIDVGIYTEENIFTDFLSPACSYRQFDRLEVCYDLIAAHAEGVSDELTVSYLTNMAVHEAHHFHEDHPIPVGATQHALVELACIELTAAQDPALNAKVQQFEQESPVYRRVYERIAVIKEAMAT